MLLKKRQHNEVNNNNNNSPDKNMAFLKSMEQQELNCVVDELSLVTERRKRCWQLVELRTAKLNQMQEIVKCEEYTQKVKGI
uniref:Uncharacterized protein n=1 Tax=Ditylenchus dipsaci TaxID=166011 RepID=A0A915EI64_9BILA